MDEVESNDIPLVMSLEGKILATLGDWREHQKAKTSTTKKGALPKTGKPGPDRHSSDRPIAPLPTRRTSVPVLPNALSLNPHPSKRPRTKHVDVSHDLDQEIGSKQIHLRPPQGDRTGITMYVFLANLTHTPCRLSLHFTTTS
jgi:hypothetical protein